MNPEFEERSWLRLRAHGAAQISPGFADRVLRAARGAAEAAPSLLGQLMLCAATATLCFLAVTAVHSVEVRAQTDRSLADWRNIAPATD